MDDKNLIGEIYKEANNLLNIFKNFEDKVVLNSNSLFLRTINHTIISINIVPFLEINDILKFRSTCKDIYHSIHSSSTLVSFYKAMKIDASKMQGKKSKVPFTNIKELIDRKY